MLDAFRTLRLLVGNWWIFGMYNNNNNNNSVSRMIVIVAPGWTPVEFTASFARKRLERQVDIMPSTI